MKPSVVRSPLWAALPLAAGIGAAVSVPVWAQSSSVSPAATALSETVVTATRTEQPLSDVVADVSIIDRDTIVRSGATGLADVLDRLPGISITRNGGPAATTSVYVRGAETRFTAVLIDGVRVDTQSGSGGASWNAIPLSQIERVEVLRGPAAAVYGSDAIGGVIQIITRKGEAGFAPSVALGMGSHGTRQLDVALSGASGAVDYALGVTRERSDGFNAKPVTGPMDDDGYDSTAFSARVGWAVANGQRLELTALRNEVDGDYDASGSKRDDDRTASNLQVLGLNWSARWSEHYGTQVRVSQSKDRYETAPSPYRTDTEITNYWWGNTWHAGAHRFSVDVERREDALDNASTTPRHTERAQNGLALGYGWNTGDHTLQLNLRHDDDSEFGGKGTGSAAYAYRLAPGLRATAGAGTAFRVPTLYQRFSAYGFAGLQPETSHNLELGLKHAWQGRSWSVVAYRNRVSNLINFGAAGTCASAFGCYENTGRASYAGVTLAGAYPLGAVRLHGSFDWMNPKNRDTGLQLARRAQRQAKAGLDTRWQQWTLGAQAQLVAHRFDDAKNTKRLGGYGVLNLSASQPLSRDWTLQLRADNLGDKAYEQAQGYATAGRTLYAGVRWQPK